MLQFDAGAQSEKDASNDRQSKGCQGPSVRGSLRGCAPVAPIGHSRAEKYTLAIVKSF